MNEQEKRYYGTSSAERTENEIEREHAHGQPTVPKREWEGCSFGEEYHFGELVAYGDMDTVVTVKIVEVS